MKVLHAVSGLRRSSKRLRFVWRPSCTGGGRMSRTSLNSFSVTTFANGRYDAHIRFSRTAYTLFRKRSVRVSSYQFDGTLTNLLTRSLVTSKDDTPRRRPPARYLRYLSSGHGCWREESSGSRVRNARYYIEVLIFRCSG